MLLTVQSSKTEGRISYKIYLQYFKSELGCTGRAFNSNEQLQLYLCQSRNLYCLCEENLGHRR